MSRNHPERFGPKPITPIAMTAVMLTAFFAVASAARSEDVARGQQIWHDKAECNFCHGWAGDGCASAALQALRLRSHRRFFKRLEPQIG